MVGGGSGDYIMRVCVCIVCIVMMAAPGMVHAVLWGCSVSSSPTRVSCSATLHGMKRGSPRPCRRPRRLCPPPPLSLFGSMLWRCCRDPTLRSRQYWAAATVVGRGGGEEIGVGTKPDIEHSPVFSCPASRWASPADGCSPGAVAQPAPGRLSHVSASFTRTAASRPRLPVSPRLSFSAVRVGMVLFVHFSLAEMASPFCLFVGAWLGLDLSHARSLVFL